MQSGPFFVLLLYFAHMLWHILITLIAFAGVWACSGVLVGTVDRLSSRFGRSHFFVSFFLLGLLTSFSEISVAVNAAIQGVPEVSVGNLIGASIVLFLLVAPAVAVAGNGVKLEHELSPGNLLAAFAVIAAPAVAAADGVLTRSEGAQFIALYAVLALLISNAKPVAHTAQASTRHIRPQHILALIAATLIIAFSGKVLVGEAVWFGDALGLPAALFGLLMLAIGTNIPEISVGIRAVRERKKGVAIGDYVGSAALNTPILGVLLLASDSVRIDTGDFHGTFIALVGGLALFYHFARSKKELSRVEGLVLIGLYACFAVWQVMAS